MLNHTTNKKYYLLLILVYFCLSAPYFPYYIKHLDSLIRKDMIEGFLSHGDWRSTDPYLLSVQSYIYTITPNKIPYPSYLPFPSFVAIPFYLFFKYFLPTDTMYALTLVNHLVVLGIILLFFKITVTYFFSPLTSFKLSLIIMTTPFLQYYQRTFFSETFFAAFILILFYFYLKEDWSRKDLFFISLTIVAGMLTKYVFILAVGLWFLFAWVTFKKKRKKLLVLFLVFIFSFLAEYYYKIWRFPPHTTFPHIYGLSYYLKKWKDYFLQGLTGQLISSGKGLFILNPLTLLGFITLFIWREKKMLFPVMLFFIYYLFYSGWPMWHGGVCFGPRFLVPVYLVFFFPLGFLLENYKKWKMKKIIAVLILLFYLLGVYINIQSLRIDDMRFFIVFTTLLAQDYQSKGKNISFLKINREFYNLTNWVWKLSLYLQYKLPASAIPHISKMEGKKKYFYFITIIICLLGSVSLSLYLLKYIFHKMT